MKKSLIALAVLAASGAAMAQSTVTLYGVADAYFGSTKINNQTQVRVNSDGLSGSRWGLRGSEDLGGGLKAVFVLESGFNIDTGNVAGGATMFGRQAFVGLNSDSFGSVSLGRHYGAYFVTKGSFLSAQANSPTFDTTNNTAVGSFGAWVGHQVRLSNSIRYETPNISGFQAAVVYGLGEDKNTALNPRNATKNASLSLTYANGPIGLAFAYQDDEFATATPASFHVKNAAIGGFYDFGVAKAFLAYNQAKLTGLSNQKEWSIGARAPLGATTLVAQYSHSSGNLAALGKNQSFGLGAEYSLTKRTTAYTALTATKLNFGGADIKDRVFGVGVRHTF